MKKRIQAVKTFVRVLLTRGKSLCNEILAASEELTEHCSFIQTARRCTLRLLNSGDAITMSSRFSSSDKLFEILRMYEAFADVLPDLQESLSRDPTHPLVWEEASWILKGLGDAARGCLSEVEIAVQEDTYRMPTPGGGIHPLTRYVMSYARALLVHSGTLDKLLDDDGDDDDDDDDDDDGRHHQSMTPFGRRLRLILSYLESNLEENSKLYKEDDAVQCIFLLNNTFYMCWEVERSELRRLLGDDWIRKRRWKADQHAAGYLTTSWNESFVSPQGFQDSSQGEVQEFQPGIRRNNNTF